LTSSQFAVGIDLGTTHCAMAVLSLADTASAGPSAALEAGARVQPVAIPQVISPGEVEARPLLPSFLYVPHASELPPQALALPWPAFGRRRRQNQATFIEAPTSRT